MKVCTKPGLVHNSYSAGDLKSTISIFILLLFNILGRIFNIQEEGCVCQCHKFLTSQLESLQESSLFTFHVEYFYEEKK